MKGGEERMGAQRINKRKEGRRGEPRAGWRRWGLAVAAVVVPLVAACNNDNDPTAPGGSTITVSANPQTVVITMSGGSGASLITATIRSENGTRLPDQEVTFTTSAGVLDPPAQTLLTTDDQGRAQSILTTNQSATVEARSGNATGTTQVQTASGDISSIVLTIMPTAIQNCNDTITLTAQVISTTGGGVSGVVVQFMTTTTSTLTGAFNPSAVVSDVMGNAVTTWTPNSAECPMECSETLGGPGCTIEFRAQDITASFVSNVVTLVDSIP